MAINESQEVVRNHPIYWFDDGSLVLDVEIQRFKVHRTLLSRHSRFFSGLSNPLGFGVLVDEETPPTDQHMASGNRHVVIDPKKLVKAKDVEVLLQHLYHDAPFNKESSWDRIASILRVTSPKQLDFPHIHQSAREIFLGIFPRDPVAFTHVHPLHEALPLATELNLTSVRKAILYSLVTTTDFDVPGISRDSTLDPQRSSTTTSLHADKNSSPTSSLNPVAHQGDGMPVVGTANTGICDSNDVDRGHQPGRGLVLSAEDAKVCMTLMTRLIEHFTPILFTPPPTSHMECTDALAEQWMPLVIQPAIEDDGVYKPLETLERLKGLEWETKGLCASCVSDKRREWTEEQRTVWEMMDGWLGIPENDCSIVVV